MSTVLSKIDDLTRPDHSYLASTDECLFLREYTSGRGYQHGETNSLILNLKKDLDRKGTSEWRYKQRAIDQAADEVRAALNPRWLATATLVPIPPSRSRTDPLYDDRMLRVLRAMDVDGKLDIRDILSQATSTPATHRSSATRNIDAIAANYRLDTKLAAPTPAVVALFDDVLTTGAHFLAARQKLRSVWPTTRVVGLFIARRVFPDPNDDSPSDGADG